MEYKTYKKKHGGQIKRRGTVRKELGIPSVSLTINDSSSDIGNTHVIILNPKQINKQSEVKLPEINICRRHLENLSPFHRKRKLPEKVWNAKSASLFQDKIENGQHFDTGIYSKSVGDLYAVLTRENSIMPPPSQTSERLTHRQADMRNLAEKRYIMNDFYKQGKIARFERDEAFIPTVYDEYFRCKRCRKEYVSKLYTEWFSKRNYASPICIKCQNDENVKNMQFCDVLGKRYCANCVENSNRQFSTNIERKYLFKYLRNSQSSSSPDSI